MFSSVLIFLKVETFVNDGLLDVMIPQRNDLRLQFIEEVLH